MSSPAIAQLLSVTLYYRRFFPYYAFCMVGGVDEEGKGAVYGYDAVGSYKRDDYGCMGSGQNFIMPILDNLVRNPCSKFKKSHTFLLMTSLCFFQIGHKNRLDEKKQLSEEEIVAIVKEVFVIATERDIYTGDSVEIKVVRKEGVKSETFQLKKD